MIDRDTAAIAGLAALGVAAVYIAHRAGFMSPQITIPTFDVPADPYPPHEPVTKYEPSEKPGVQAFRAWVLDELGGKDMGISRALKGGKPTSKHHEGRAWDWGPPSDAAASVLLDALLRTIDGDQHALARRAGIRVMIWQGKIWTGGTREWRPYNKVGGSPHYDHIHFGFSWDGANGKTSFYELEDGKVQVAQLSGIPEPVSAGDGELVEPVLTPLSDLQLAEVLSQAHVRVTGEAPSYNRLGMAWAQVQGETGRTLKAYNHNWGNIKAFNWDGDRFRYPELDESMPYFRSYPDAITGAADYWRVLTRQRYVAALAAFDAGDPHAAATELRAAGYYTAPLERYSLTLSQLFDEYGDKFKNGNWSSLLAPLVIAGGALAALTWISEKY